MMRKACLRAPPARTYSPFSAAKPALWQRSPPTTRLSRSVCQGWQGGPAPVTVDQGTKDFALSGNDNNAYQGARGFFSNSYAAASVADVPFHNKNGRQDSQTSYHTSNHLEPEAASSFRGFFDDTPDFFSSSSGSTSAYQPAPFSGSSANSKETDGAGPDHERSHGHAASTRDSRGDGGFFSRWDSWDNTSVHNHSAAMGDDSHNGSSFFSSSTDAVGGNSGMSFFVNTLSGDGDSGFQSSWDGRSGSDGYAAINRGGTHDDEGGSQGGWGSAGGAHHTSDSLTQGHAGSTGDWGASGHTYSSHGEGHSANGYTGAGGFFSGTQFTEGDGDTNRFQEPDPTDGEGAAEEEDDNGSGGGFFSEAFKMALSQALERAAGQGEEPFSSTKEEDKEPYAPSPLPALQSFPKRDQSDPPSALEEVLSAAMDASMTSLNRLVAIKNEVERAIEREKMQLERLEFALDKAKKDEAYYRVLSMMQERGRSDLED